MKIILTDIEPDNLICGIRAAKWMLGQDKKKDAVLTFGENLDLYVKRNKASITVRQCNWVKPTR